jgi:hypothetical protein
LKKKQQKSLSLSSIPSNNQMESQQEKPKFIDHFRLENIKKKFSKDRLKAKFSKENIKKFFLRQIFQDDPRYAKETKKKGEDTAADDERENWGGKLDFFLSALGYAVGLGAVWRFPYLCYKNGGGVFFIPYTIFLFFVGIPLFFLELNLGQYTSKGPVLCFEMAPIFKGVGLSMIIASFYFAIYYNMIIAYSIYYLFLSIRPTLEWSKCNFVWAGLSEFVFFLFLLLFYLINCRLN